jgi:radical SAM protein with 4Fe4S-binding SPASM domain
VRIEGIGFTAQEIADCAQRQGLLSFEIDLDSRGSCRCATCESDSANAGKVLSASEILGVVDQAKKLGAVRTILVDSEPESFGNLQQVIEGVRDRGMQVELFTHRAAITAQLANFLHKQRVAVVLGLRELDQDLKTRAAINHLKEAGYCETDSLRLAIQIEACQENLAQIPGIWRWARGERIEPYVQIITPRKSSGEKPKIVSSQSIRLLFEELGRIDQLEFGHEWKNPPSLTGRSCKRHLFACHMTPCGNIYACVGVTISLGNIRSEPLRDILQLSEVLENLRAYGQFVKEPCKTCSQSTDCYGCRGAAYQLTGDYLAGDQFCWKADGVEVETLPAPVAGFIPHGPSMRVIDRLVQVGERRSRTEFLVRGTSPFIDETGRLDELAYIEMIAQSFAATHGFHLSPEQRGLQRGFLLAVKDFFIAGEAHVGDVLTVAIHKITRFGDFGVVEGEIRHQNGSLIASAEVKIWRASGKAVETMNS